MARLSIAAAYLMAAAASCTAFTLPTTTTRITTATSTNPLSMSTATVDETFKSESAKQQIGNDSFLNKNLMARAENGPGKTNQEKLKI